MGQAIQTELLSKSFGSIDAVVDLDLEVEVGEVFGFLGPNGSGKSTTIKLLLDEIRPTSGRVTVLGLDAHEQVVDVHRRVGYLPGELRLPHQVTGAQYLHFLATIRGGGDSSARRRELIERFDLDPGRRIGQMSAGKKQKIGLVQAFMHQPELLLLDEPTAGLDPLVQYEFHQLLLELSAQGTTIFLSSHTLSEIDRVADRVGIIRAGRLVAVNKLASLKRQARRRLELDFDSPPAPQLSQAAGVISVEARGNTAIVILEGSADDLLRKALESGTVLSITTPEADLEDIFLNFYRGENGTAS